MRASSIRMRQSGRGQQKRRQQLKADALYVLISCATTGSFEVPCSVINFSTSIQNFSALSVARTRTKASIRKVTITKKSMKWTVSKRWSRWSSFPYTAREIAGSSPSLSIMKAYSAMKPSTVSSPNIAFITGVMIGGIWRTRGPAARGVTRRAG